MRLALLENTPLMKAGEDVAVTYQEAGVDIQAGNQAVDLIKEEVKKTWRPEVLTDLGGFGGLFALNKDQYSEPVLVSGTDGVGTKLRIAQELQDAKTIGQDLVAMCVNDILVYGAEPLFFLDYLATGQLQPTQVAEIVAGIAQGCTQAGCALIGGETAEMPGFYPPGDYDLAGFVVGVVERRKIIDGSKIKVGDVLLGIPSSGLHSNGFSLARRVLLDLAGFGLQEEIPELGRTLGAELLEPTRIYAQLVQGLLPQFSLHGMAHITGGGLLENLPRIFGPGQRARIQLGSWLIPPIFKLIQSKGPVLDPEMYRTFNMGLGLVLVVDPQEAEPILDFLHKQGEKASRVGEIVSGEPGVDFVETDGV